MELFCCPNNEVKCHVSLDNEVDCILHEHNDVESSTTVVGYHMIDKETIRQSKDHIDRKMSSTNNMVPTSRYHDDSNDNNQNILVLLELPCTVLTCVFQFLDLQSIQACQCSCRALYRHIRVDPEQQRSIWEPLYYRKWPWLKQQQQQQQVTTDAALPCYTNYTKYQSHDNLLFRTSGGFDIALDEAFELVNNSAYNHESSMLESNGKESRYDESSKIKDSCENLKLLPKIFPNHSMIIGLGTSRQPTGIDVELVKASSLYNQKSEVRDDNVANINESIDETIFDKRNEIILDEQRRVRSIPLLQFLQSQPPYVSMTNTDNDDDGRYKNPIFTIVQYTGEIGIGSRSVQANHPLPKPSSVVPTNDVGTTTNCRRRRQRRRNGYDEYDGDLPFVVPLCCSSQTSTVTTIDKMDVVTDEKGRTDPANGPRYAIPSSFTFQISPRFIAYYEVTILPSPIVTVSHPIPRHNGQQRQRRQRRRMQHERSSEECIAVGLAIGTVFASSDRIHRCMPGWDTNTIGYHSDNGRVYHGHSIGIGTPFGPTFGVGDTIGCGIDYYNDSVFYTLNGTYIDSIPFYHCLYQQHGSHHHDYHHTYQTTTTKSSQSLHNNNGTIPNKNCISSGLTTTTTRRIPHRYISDLYPVVGIDSSCPISFNFGTGNEPFLYNLVPMIRQQKGAVLARIFSI